MKPSDRIREIQREIAKVHMTSARQHLIDRGIPEQHITLKLEPNDPDLLPEAIVRYLDEAYLAGAIKHFS